MFASDTVTRRHFLQRLSAGGALPLMLPLVGCNDSDDNESRADTIASIAAIGPHREGKTTFGAALSRITSIVSQEQQKSFTVLSTDDIDAAPEDAVHGMTAGVSWHEFSVPGTRFQFANIPGVNRFYRNHMAGKGFAETGAYVAFADTSDSQPEKIREHMFNARLQGIEQMVAVINLRDDQSARASEQAATLEVQLKREAARYGYANMAVYQVNLERAAAAADVESQQQMRQVLANLQLAALTHTMAQRRAVPFMLNVFRMRMIDSEPVLLGQVERGSVAVGDSVAFIGRDEAESPLTVRSIEHFNRPVSAAYTGEMIGIGFEQSPVFETAALRSGRRVPGRILAQTGAYSPSSNFVGRLAVPEFSAAHVKLYNNMEVTAHRFGRGVTARVRFESAGRFLTPGATLQTAELMLAEPTVLLPDDSVVLMRGGQLMAEFTATNSAV
ncbi:Elongation factor Tu [BD1-7 clade bacterium]|uniref:Elongation factor Tu n=1 Tax=BD1-7 clade bacterium TaxID=2029982 RepID=A0A5S9R168_9GAMM|nr:Elongation factor Tu [BD1-7 clade bacterium]